MKVTVLGLGIMGAGMARQLVRKYFDVTVWNRNAAKAAPLMRRARASPPRPPMRRAVPTWCSPCWPMMTPRAACGSGAGGRARGDARRRHRHRVEHADGRLDARACGRRAGARRRFPRRAGDRQQGAGRERRLAFLVGGPAELLERARPALAAMSGSIAHLGPCRQRRHDETHQQFPLRRAGGEPCGSHGNGRAQRPRRAPGGRGAGSRLARQSAGQDVAQRMLDRAYEPNFFVPLMAKDLDYARRAFALAGIELKSAEVAREAFRRGGARRIRRKRHCLDHRAAAPRECAPGGT